MFGFVSVGFNEPATTEDKAKTYGNFLDNINFEIFHPLSGSSTLHGSGVVGGSDGTTSGTGGLSSGYTVTVDDKLLTYAVDGEPLQATRMIVTPAAVENFFNVSAQAYIDVHCGCCSTVAVQNTSAQAIEVQNSNLIAVREA